MACLGHVKVLACILLLKVMSSLLIRYFNNQLSWKFFMMNKNWWKQTKVLKGMPPYCWLDDPETEYPWYDNGVIL